MVTYRPKFKYRETWDDKIFSLVKNVFMLLATISVAYPLIYIVSASISDSYAVMSGEVVLWPVRPSLDAYRAVFRSRQLMIGYRNSLLYTSLGTAINLFVTLLAAYPLSRKDFYGRNLFMLFFSFTMLFSGGLIPTYLLVLNLGMINTVWAMVIPNAMSVWNMIIMRTYFQSNISIDLCEAAELDGCSDIRIIWRIVLPLSGPILAVMALFYAVGHWNSYFNALIYLTSPNMQPLQMVLRNILILFQPDADMTRDMADFARRQGVAQLLRFAVIIVSSLPVLIIYPFVQKYFVKGVMIGSLKG